MKCPICKTNMVPRGYEHVTVIGQRKVIDGTGIAPRCLECGGVELTEEQLAGYERRAARVILAEARDVSGDVLKFARKALGMRQSDLADRLGSNPQQISRYENDSSIEMWLRLAMVGLLDAADRGELECIGKRDDAQDIHLKPTG